MRGEEMQWWVNAFSQLMALGMVGAVVGGMFRGLVGSPKPLGPTYLPKTSSSSTFGDSWSFPTPSDADAKIAKLDEMLRELGFKPFKEEFSPARRPDPERRIWVYLSPTAYARVVRRAFTWYEPPEYYVELRIESY